MSTSQLERRYRRVLSLLPRGYRQQWEDDMVASFLAVHEESNESTVDSRVPLGEVASVVGLAVRARLFALHAAPRTLAWYHTVRAFTVLSLLVLSYLYTSQFAFGLAYDSSSSVPWSAVTVRAFDLLCVATLVAVALNAIRTARGLGVLSLVVMAVGLVATVVAAGTRPPFGPPLINPVEVFLACWQLVAVVGLFGPAPGLRLSTRFWLGAYGFGALVIAGSTTYLAHSRPEGGISPWFQVVNPIVLLSYGLAVTSVVALGRAVRGRAPSPHWLLALIPFNLLVGITNLLVWPIRNRFDAPNDHNGLAFFGVLSSASDLALIGMSLVAAVVSVVLLRRISAQGDHTAGPSIVE